MENFLNKTVRYIGNNSKTLITGNIYPVSHIYGENVGVLHAPNHFTSTPYTNLEIVGNLNPDDTLTVHAILLYNDQVAGVRFKEDGIYCDVEIERLQTKKPLTFTGYKTQTLEPHGDLLLTKEEVDSNFHIVDKSWDKYFCNRALSLLQNKR